MTPTSKKAGAWANDVAKKELVAFEDVWVAEDEDEDEVDAATDAVIIVVPDEMLDTVPDAADDVFIAELDVDILVVEDVVVPIFVEETILVTIGDDEAVDGASVVDNGVLEVDTIDMVVFDASAPTTAACALTLFESSPKGNEGLHKIRHDSELMAFGT